MSIPVTPVENPLTTVSTELTSDQLTGLMSNFDLSSVGDGKYLAFVTINARKDGTAKVTANFKNV